MSRSKKQSAPETPATRPEPTAERDTDSARGVLRHALATLRRQIEILDARQAELLPGGFDDKLANAISTANRAAAGVVAELRQLEKHDRLIVEAMSPDELNRVVFAYVEGLDRDGRAVFRELLAEIDGQESLLGG